MRKALGLLFATSLLVPIGVFAAGPAGSAVNTKLPTCKSFSGSATYTPGLPILSSKVLVTPTQSSTGTYTGCTGGGITGGTSKGSVKITTATNCTKLFKDAAAKTPGKPTPATVKWSNGQTTTASVVLTVTGIKGTALTATLTSKITAGLGVGHTSVITVLATPNAGWCTKAPLGKTVFKSTKITNK